MKGTKESKTKQSGITLIALIITIIVMLILVSVTIAMAVNGGLFDYAGKATSETKNAIKDEQWLADGGIQIGDVYYTIDEYLSQVTENNGSRIKLSYKVTPAEDNLSAVITVNAKMLGGLIKGFEDYKTWALKKLEGKTQEEIEQIFLNGLNYVSELLNTGLPKFSDIEEFVGFYVEEGPDVFKECKDIYDMIQVMGFNSLVDCAIDGGFVYPEQYEFMDDYYLFAKRELHGKTNAEIEQIVVDGINYEIEKENLEMSKFKSIQDYVTFLKEGNPEVFGECENIYDVIQVIGFNSLVDFAIETGTVYPEKFSKIDKNIKEKELYIIDPDGNVWDDTNKVEFIVYIDGEYTFKAINEVGTASNSITVKIDMLGSNGEKFSQMYRTTEIYTDKNKETAVIPKGFSVGMSDGINTIDDGLVIQDAKGNQFVWIPVEYTATGITDENGLDSGFKKVFKRSETRLRYTDLCEEGFEGEETEYYEMMLSVQKNKGFYIGRFEAGTQEPRYPEVENGTDELVIKRDVYPYNNVAWGKAMDDWESIIKYNYDSYELDDEYGLNQGHGAVYLSKNLLKGQVTDAVTTLCYGVQWDAMLRFMGKDKEENSVEWGNYLNSEYTITRTTAKFKLNGQQWTQVPANGKRKIKDIPMLLTTGASDEFKIKNIYDVAGNLGEWTMENDNYVYRLTRSSSWNNGGHCTPLTYIWNYPWDPSYDHTFRVALLIN